MDTPIERLRAHGREAAARGETIVEQPPPEAIAARWDNVRAWLRTRDADRFVDEAVLGGLPEWEAVELLAEHGLPAGKDALRKLGVEVDAAITAGQA